MFAQQPMPTTNVNVCQNRVNKLTNCSIQSDQHNFTVRCILPVSFLNTLPYDRVSLSFRIFCHSKLNYKFEGCQSSARLAVSTCFAEDCIRAHQHVPIRLCQVTTHNNSIFSDALIFAIKITTSCEFSV